MRILTGAGVYGVGYTEQLRVPTMSVGTYSLASGALDRQSPHAQDEIYVVTAGRARFVSDDGSAEVKPGDVIFVPAGEAHRFVDISEDISLLVIFAPAESAS
jgi:mannose-6-phosphate isomerase-like protein (cupin superfamily)